jgi:hypothetical protein
MYSFSFDWRSLNLKSQIHEEIFSLLGNSGKTIAYSRNLSVWWTLKLKKIWEHPYKKAIGYSLILLFWSLISPPETSFASETEKTFIVTAYYSPLPNQSFYLRGNYEAEKKLNGNGTNGASGTPVFTGMIAAPKSYSFGTQIFFPGLGVGRVEDRGWAIVDAWVRGQPYDRIDIWMGHGETGLKRALLWWRREVKWTILTENNPNMNGIDLEWIDTGRVNLKDFPSVKSESVWWISSDIVSAFADLGYIVEWKDVSAMIFSFQKDHGIVSKESDAGAWVFWPKTKAALAESYAKYTSLKDEELKAIENAKKILIDERTSWEERYNQANTFVSQIGFPRNGDRWENVAILQDILKQEWFFKWKRTGVMAWGTISALKKYQKSRGLSPTGVIDAFTKNALVDDKIEA